MSEEMRELGELISRVEIATGPDREIDALVHAIVIGPRMEAAIGDNRTVWCWPSLEANMGINNPYRFTGSVEEAEYALPGPEWPEWQITRRFCTGYHANVGLGDDGVGCETAALALLSQALRARLSTLREQTP